MRVAEWVRARQRIVRGFMPSIGVIMRCLTETELRTIDQIQSHTACHRQVGRGGRGEGTCATHTTSWLGMRRVTWSAPVTAMLMPLPPSIASSFFAMSFSLPFS